MKSSIEFGSDLRQINRFFNKKQEEWSSIFILVDSNTHEYCLPQFLSGVSFSSNLEIIEVEAGEASKDLEIAQGLWITLNELNADRRSLLINLGGGVVSDLGAWVAANYKRGIDFINIPTTLLAMVDASIGGKTGIDLAGIKNLIGSFSAPKKIFIYPHFLDTLPEKEWLSGYAEMLKHALISDKKLWSGLKKINIEEHKKIKPFIAQSSTIKMDIVERDFYEEGERKILNFGHTVGHAIESISIERNEALSHGHAIGIGMVWESVISFQMNLLSKDQLKEVMLTLLQLYDLPIWLKDESSRILAKMKKDKKNAGDTIHMVLLNSIGEASFDHVVGESMIADSLEFIYSFSSNE